MRSEKGGTIVGERVLCEFLKMSKPQLIHMTGMHRGSRITLWGSETRPVFCIVDKELRLKR